MGDNWDAGVDMQDAFEQRELATARHGALGTEKARRVPKGALGQVFNLVLSRGERGATHFEVNAALGWHDAQASRPLSRLVQAGQIVRLLETRTAPNGNDASVHVHPLFVKGRACHRPVPRG